MTLSAIKVQQANSMDATIAQVKHFLVYCATHEDAVIT